MERAYEMGYSVAEIRAACRLLEREEQRQRQRQRRQRRAYRCYTDYGSCRLFQPLRPYSRCFCYNRRGGRDPGIAE